MNDYQDIISIVPWTLVAVFASKPVVPLTRRLIHRQQRLTTVRKIIAMESISNGADITYPYSWSETTI